MRRRAVLSVLGATALFAASVAGASSASALGTGATAPAHDFGSVPVFSSVQQDITVTASGGPVTFGAFPSIAVANGDTGAAADYSVVSTTCTGTVATDATCTVTVAFTPFAAGARAANLSIETTTPPDTVLVGLTGTGVPNATGTYYGLTTPTRFLDTRLSNGAPLGAGATRSVQITGLSGIPAASAVSAVVFNLTAVKTTSSGYITAYPSGKARPTASSINFPSGWTGANMVTLPVGTDGKINLFNYAGTAHVIVDVLGWYAKDDSVRATKGMGAQFLATATGDPVRIYDSRKDDANGRLPLANGEYLEVRDTWASQQAAANVKAYALTVTAVGATGPGVLTAWAGGAVRKPLASAVNYDKGVVAPNMVVVPAGHVDPAHPEFFLPEETGFRIQNSGSSVHLVVDVAGYYVQDDSAGMRFRPLPNASAPVRILDTRKALGLSGPFGSSQTRTVNATSVSTPDSAYVIGNTTGVTPTVATYLTVWSGDNPLPGTSNLNVNPTLVRAVSTYAPLAFANAVPPAPAQLTFKIFNRAGSMNVLFDAAGTLDQYPAAATPPAGAQSPATADVELGGRTIPGARSLAAGHEGTSTRRG